MGGYSKSRSTDFLDLSLSPKQVNETNPGDPKAFFRSNNQLEFSGEDINGVEASARVTRLSRNFSSASQRFNSSNHGSSGALQTVVRRAFSMRRSSTLTDGYWRIHDTGDDDDDDDDQTMRPPRKKKKKGGKLIRACKRLFGF